MTIAYQASTTFESTVGTGGSTSSIDTRGSGLIVVAILRYLVGTFTDSASNTWTLINTTTSGFATLEWYYVIAPITSASHTFTYTNASDAVPTIHAVSYTGGGIVFDKKTFNSATATSIAPGSLTPANNNSLLVAAHCHNLGELSVVDEGYVERGDTQRVAGQHMGGAYADLIQGVAAAVSPTFTGTGSNPRVAGHAVFYQNITGRIPLIQDTGVVQQIQDPDFLEDVVYATATLSPDNTIVRVDGARKEVQASTALITDAGDLTLTSTTTMETSGAHTPILTILDSAGSVSFSIVAALLSTANFGLGSGCLPVLTSGTGNTAIGTNAGNDLTEASDCVLIGSSAGAAITTGVSNVFIGQAAGFDCVTGEQNLAIGDLALSNATGSRNTGLGQEAGVQIIAGLNNVFVGRRTGHNASQGTGVNDTTVVGTNSYSTGNNAMALGANTNAAANQVVIGDSGITETVLRSKVSIISNSTEETSGSRTAAFEIIDSEGAVAVEIMAGLEADENLFIGLNSGLVVQTGAAHTAGVRNVVIGHTAGEDITTATNNMLLGARAGKGISTGGFHVLVGTFAGQSITTGTACVGIGYAALLSTTGSANTCIGQNGGRSVTSGSNNTFIGNNAGHTGQTGNVSNSTGIGNGVVTTATNQVVIGNSSVTLTNLKGNVFTGTGAYETLKSVAVTGTKTLVAPCETLVLGDATSGAFSVFLPTAASMPDTPITVKKVDASGNAVTIDGNGSETIDGATTKTLAAQYDSMTVVSDGTTWHITAVI